jgi:hypothetical protein
MTKKMKLSDETLNNVSGGVLTVGGNEVTEFGLMEWEGEQGIFFTTSEGSFFSEFDDETVAAIKSDPSQEATIMSSLIKKVNSSKLFRVEDL